MFSRFFRQLLLLSFVLLFFTPTLKAQYEDWVGIPSETLNYFAASQQKEQWCWAACIEMVLNYHGIDITQEQIVERTYGVDPYGNLPDWAGSYDVIHQNLNNWSFDNNGRRYIVESYMGWGAPHPEDLLDELAHGFPIIIGYSTGHDTGHAVVLTAASFVGQEIQTIVVRDPWPSDYNLYNLGRVEYDAYDLASHIEVYWIIRVSYL